MLNNKIDLSKYVVNVQGKDFITFPGLLAEAHSQGLVGIETSLINPDSSKNPIVKAIVTLKGEGPQNFKVFTGYGDATETNVAKKVVGALLRMAETRAIARALRFACNIDMTAIEELDADESTHKPTTAPKSFSRAKAPAVESSPVKEPIVVTKGQEQMKPSIPTEVKSTAKPGFGRRSAQAVETKPKSEPSFP
jgi:hypothetical protein